MVNEKRLIDANAIQYRTIGCGGWGMPEQVVSDYEIDKMHTVDAVEVVRCKDCHNCTKSKWCNLLMMDVKDEWFCSHGERNDND